MVLFEILGCKLGEYDEVGRGLVSSKSSSHSEVIKSSFGWLAIALSTLIVSPFFLLFIGTTSIGFALAYGFAILATLISVLAVFEDQRRMRSPSYSLNKNFRKISAILYSGSSFVVVLYIFMVAFNAARK